MEEVMRKEEGLEEGKPDRIMGINYYIFPHTWTLEIHMLTYDIEAEGGYLARGRALVRVRQMVGEGTEANGNKL